MARMAIIAVTIAASVALTVPTACAALTNVPVTLFNVSTVPSIATDYELQALVYSLQGIANRGTPRLFYDTGSLDLDYPDSDRQWAQYLSAEKGVVFTTISSGDVCALVRAFASGADAVVNTTVWYASDGFSIYPALTAAGVYDALPVSAGLAARYPACLDPAVAPPTALNLTTLGWANEFDGYGWAMEHLLPRCAKDIVFNANHYHNAEASNNPMMSVDYPISKRAFIMNLCPLWVCDDLDCHPPSTRKGTPEETKWFVNVLSHMDELVSVWGWSDPEHAYTNITAHAGGTVFCTFSSPNLSLWRALGELLGESGHPVHNVDAGLQYNASKIYVMSETNEGDTPRILTSQFTSAWLSPNRGSVPVGWAVDPLLGEFFPLLWNYYIDSATANDTFVGGVDGSGYVFLDSLGPHAAAYARRASAMLAKYSLDVVDVGVAEALWPATPLADIETYVRNSGASSGGGGAPSVVLNACGSAWGQRVNDALPNGTPIVNSVCYGPHNSTRGHYLYYYRGQLNQTDPSGDLASRMLWAASEFYGAKTVDSSGQPHVMLLFGGLGLYGGHDDYFLFMQRVMEQIAASGSPDADRFELVGAADMVRLVHDATSRRVQ